MITTEDYNSPTVTKTNAATRLFPSRIKKADFLTTKQEQLYLEWPQEMAHS